LLPVKDFTPALPAICAPTLPSTSNWLTFEEVPPASISIMISNPILIRGVTVASPRRE
jgi:hypothetical protein